MRKPILNSIKFLILQLIIIVMITQSVPAATISSIGNGNWSATAWPNTTRTGTITTSTASTTVTGAAGSLFLTEISIGNIIKTTGNVVIGTVLSITNNTSLILTVNAVSSNAAIAYNVQGVGSGDLAQISAGNTITVDVATAVCASFQSDNLSAAGTAILVFSTGSHLTVSGLVKVGGNATHLLSIDMTSGGIFTCGNFSIFTVGTWTPGSGTIELTTTNTLPAGFFTSFNNLSIVAGTTTTAVGIAINSKLLIADGASFSAGAFALTVTGTTTVGSGTSGNLTLSSTTAATFSGLVTINVGGIWNNSGNAAITFQGGITNNSTFTAGTGVQTFNTNSQALTGTFSIPSVTVTVVTLTNNNTLSVTTTLAGSGTLAQAVNATLNIVFTGSFGITGLTASANGNTVNYGFAGTQTVFPVSYYHLTLSNTSAKTLLAGTTSIGGNLTLSGTASTLAVVGLTIGGNVTIGAGTAFTPSGFTHSIAGNWSRSGTFTAGTSTIIFNGSPLQTLTATGGENFASVTINNSGAGVQFANAITIATTLNMTLGNIDLNGSNLTLGTSAAAKGTLTRVAGTIIGTGSFIRWFNTSTIVAGSVTGLFPVGTATDFRPFYISAPVTGPVTGGTITLSYTNSITNTAVSFADAASTVVLRKDLNFNLVTGNGLAGGTYNLRADGTGYGTIGNITDLRLTLLNSVAGAAGVNAGTILNPQINRTGLSMLNLTNSFYVASINAASTTLPVTLISFTASVVEKRFELNWSTSAETDNNFFTVQRSKNTGIWEGIEQVGSAGSKTVSFYTSYDQTPYTGISYYRLMQTDLDGRQTYSAIRYVNFETAPSTVTVFPNPATDHVIIAFHVAGKYEVSLINGNGQIIFNPVLVTGDHFLLNVSNLKTGLYLIRVHSEIISEIKKIVIERN